MFKLVIADDEGKTTVVPLVRDEITIGRKEGNTIRLTERNVSRRHARLKKANGAFLIEDLGSYNGVKVNGKRIERELKLGAGDQISIGDYLLALQLDAAEVATSQTTAPLGPSAANADAATTMLQAPATSPRPPARIVMLSPPAPGAEFALTRAKVRLGRAEDLEVWVNHRSISREHAEIVRDGDAFKIRDLGSANGVRVNGQDIEQASLKAGDVVELGQVRFRFVAEGEVYTFEADRTIQVDAIEGPPSSKAPIFAAVGIVAVAIAVAAMLAMSGAEDPEMPELAGEGDPIAEAQATNGTEGDPAPAIDVDEAAARCQTALGERRYGDAVAAADEALRASPQHAGAAACRQQAIASRSETEIFEQGRQALERQDVEGAYVAFEQLPEGSELRQRNEVQTAMRQYAERQLARARELSDRDPVEAMRHLGVLRTMAGAPEDLQRDGDRLERIIRRNQATALAAGTRRERTERTERTERQNTRQQTQQQEEQATQQQQQQQQQPAQPDCNPAQPDFNQCVIRRYEGRARTPRELELLIETYRTMGNTPKMLQNMAEFVRRYPTHNRTSHYRQFLQRHGQ